MKIDLGKILIRNKRDEELRAAGWTIETGNDPCLKYDNKYYPIWLLKTELPVESFTEIRNYFKKNSLSSFGEFKVVKAELTSDNKLLFISETKGVQ